MHKPSSRDDEGIVPYEFYEGSRNNWGIATPVCGLVRNDMRCSGLVRNDIVSFRRFLFCEDITKNCGKLFPFRPCYHRKNIV